MAENKVRFLRGTAAEYADAIKDDDTFYYTIDDEKFYVGSKEITGGGITVDSELSDTSTNPVQNKVIKAAIDNKADKTTATTDTDGLMSASDKTKLDNVNNTYALKSKYGNTTINVGRKAGTTVGIFSTAEGCNTTASGDYSHASGHYTITTKEAEAAFGIANESNDDTLFSIGRGQVLSMDGSSSDEPAINRYNAFEITNKGGKLHGEDIATVRMIPSIDSAISSTSTNPVQNKVINSALNSIEQTLTEKTNDKFNAITCSTPLDEKSNIPGVNAINHSFKYESGMIRGDGAKVSFPDIINSYIEYNLADASKGGLMSAEHFNFLEKYKKIRDSSASYTFTSMQDYITVNNCYGNCNNGLVVLSGWFTSTGSAGNPTIISGSFPSAASSFVCGIIVNIDSPNTNTRLLVRHESDGTSSLQCGGSITAGKYFFIGVYTAERCAYNLPYTL